MPDGRRNARGKSAGRRERAATYGQTTLLWLASFSYTFPPHVKGKNQCRFINLQCRLVVVHQYFFPWSCGCSNTVITLRNHKVGRMKLDCVIPDMHSTLFNPWQLCWCRRRLCTAWVNSSDLWCCFTEEHASGPTWPPSRAASIRQEKLW